MNKIKQIEGKLTSMAEPFKDHREYPDILKINTVKGEYFCLDLETTSLTSENEGILEIYWMHMKDGVKVKEAHHMFWHPNHEATFHINEIPKEEIENQPVFDKNSSELKDVINPIIEYLNRCCDPNDPIALMAQYVPFEIVWMSEKLEMNLVDMKIKVYDTRSTERFLNPEVESASLIPMCFRRGIPSPNGESFHRAQWDVEAMWKVAKQQFQELRHIHNIHNQQWVALK